MPALHAKLEADTFPVAEDDFCWLRCMNDQRFAWLILVPKQGDLKEWHHMSEQDQQHLLALVNQCAVTLESVVQPDKINIGALGNLVPQLHVHVIARFSDDPCWPGPVWGNGEPVPFAKGVQPDWLSGQRGCAGVLQALLA